MRKVGGSNFTLQGRAEELVTVLVVDGTVDEVVADLDGVETILHKNQPLKFKFDKDHQRVLYLTYNFKADSGEWYRTSVTGDPGTDVSIDDYHQAGSEASRTRRYTFDVA